MGEEHIQQYAHLRKVPAERWAGRVLPASAAVWTAAEIMHLAAFPGALDLAVATALASGFAWGASGRWPRIPRQLPWWIAGAGGWLTVAAADGPLREWPWPHPWSFPLTFGWAAAALIARRRARYHPTVIEAQQWRAQREQWLGTSHDWGLGGTHLLGFRETRLGEEYELDVKSTGKRASQIAGSQVAEVIAERENLPAVSRVHVRAHRPGRVKVLVRRTDPWAQPILHPVVAEDPEIDLSGAYSITAAAAVGQDPETGRVLAVPLWDGDTGGKNVFLLGLKGAGKGVLLDNLSERITAAPDAIQFRVNLSIKGPAEAERWGPSCHLTAFGRDQADRAVKVLRVVNGILEWRSRRYATGQYDPSPADPLVVVIFDESDSAMAVPAVRKLTEVIATKGREYGADLVRAGQRGTTDYGSAKIRSQDDVFCVGKVSRMGEVYHAAGSAGFAIPDLAAYGEGAPGVWAIAELGGGQQIGRTWILGRTRADQAAAVARIARERAFSQPELHPDCVKFLGDAYAELLATDVFAEWARDKAEDEGREFMAGRPRIAPPGPATKPEVSSPVIIADADIDHLVTDMDIDPEARRVLAEIDRKLASGRENLRESARIREAAPKVPQEKIDAFIAERWRQVGEAAQIPDEAREPLVILLRQGTTISEVAETFSITKWIARTWLEKLRNEDIARIDGKGRGARFRLVEGGDGS